MSEFLEKIGMTGVEFSLGIALLVVAAALIVLVLFQTGKDQQSGAVSGSVSETYLGKSKTASKDKKLSIATMIVSILFALVVLAMYFYIAIK